MVSKLAINYVLAMSPRFLRSQYLQLIIFWQYRGGFCGLKTCTYRFFGNISEVSSVERFKNCLGSFLPSLLQMSAAITTALPNAVANS